MDSSMTRRLMAAGVTVALVSLLAVGCDEEASPTVPAPPAPAPPPPPPEDPVPPQIRAEEVVDRETLRLFVEAAIHAASEGISSEDEAYAFFDTTFRPEGAWRHGEIYLSVIELDGTSFFHPTLPHLEGQDLSDTVDVQGVRATEELLAAAAAGGGYVEYLWDNPTVEDDEETGSPKVSYAALATLGGKDFVILSGIYPPVTAADVRNRGTLKSFVERAAAVLSENSPDLEAAYAFADANFRPEGEWRHGEIYVFIDTMELMNFFHATAPEVEGQDRCCGVDPNGVNIGQELRAAAEAGGGYVEFLHDNPAVEGDEETKSRKLAYTTGVTVASVPMMLTSGIYLDHPGEE